MSVRKQYQFRIPTNHPCLAGHFPDHPVVPGVVLLDNVLQCIEDQISTNTSERVESRIKITAAKFLQPVLPEQLVRLEISVKPDKFDFLGSVSGIPVVSGSSKFVTEQVT